MPLQKIKFQTNIPVEAALKFAEGKLCDSQFGDPQYMCARGSAKGYTSPTVARTCAAGSTATSWTRAAESLGDALNKRAEQT